MGVFYLFPLFKSNYYRYSHGAFPFLKIRYMYSHYPTLISYLYDCLLNITNVDLTKIPDNLFQYMYMYKVWTNEMENKVYLYVNKCEVLKTLYLYKVSSRINLKCNIHSLNSLNEYLLCEIIIIIQIKQKLDWNIFFHIDRNKL